jgi:hypothetical protein
VKNTKTIFRINQITQIILYETHDRNYNCSGAPKTRICTDRPRDLLAGWPMGWVVQNKVRLRAQPLILTKNYLKNHSAPNIDCLLWIIVCNHPNPLRVWQKSELA